MANKGFEIAINREYVKSQSFQRKINSIFMRCADFETFF